MATTSNATPANANYLANKTGLSPAAAYAWIAAEGQQDPNPTNPLNIKSGGTPGQTGTLVTSYGNFAQYPSTQAGLDAAAWLIKNGSYSGIRSAITTGNPVTQTKAIDSSKWGTSGAYNALANAEQLLGATTPTNTASAPTGTIAHLLGAGTVLPNLDPSSGLTQGEIDTIMGDVPVDNPNYKTIQAALQAQLGTPINTLTEPSNWTFSASGGLQNLIFGQAGTSGTGGGILDTGATPATVAGSAGDILGALSGFASADLPAFGALIFGGLCMLGGVFLIYKDTSSGGTNTVIQEKTIPIVYKGAE